MRRRNAYLVTVGLILSTSRVLGQTSSPDENLFARLQWVELDVEAGRLVARTHRHSQSRSHSRSGKQEGCREALTVTVHRGMPSVLYERADDESELLVEITEGSQVLIFHTRQQDGGAAVRTEFHQDRSGHIVLQCETTGSGEERAATVYEAAGFWHLTLAHPDVCREHLYPLLRQLRPEWDLDQTVNDLKASLTRFAEESDIPDREYLEELVEQLSDPTFRRRNAADRALRGLGYSAVSFLRQLDPDRLDTEQRIRIRQIQQSILVQESDTPDRVAALLAFDASVWIRVLENGDERQQIAAAAHLSGICSRPVQYDPTAEPDQRALQIAELRRQIFQ